MKANVGTLDRAARISQNFLSFSRGPDTIVRSFDLGDLAAEVRELTLRPAVAANIEINVRRAPSGEGTIVTDPYQLRQVLLNLVTNALHAVARDGTVELVVEDGPVHASIAVVDSGPGIAEEHIEHIFEPFFTTKKEGHGTGLGLAVSRGIVEKLGGRLEVENRPGSGCSFRVVLPKSRE